MRIGLVTDTYTPQVNGVTTVVRRIVEALEGGGHTVAVAAPRYPGPRGADDPRELRVASLPFPPYPAIRLSLPRPSQLTRFLDPLGPQLIHVHTEGPLGLAGRRYALRRGLPLLTTFHTDFPRYARQYGVGFLAPLVWRWLAWFHRPARHVFTPGEATRAELRRHGIGAAQVWGRGVDPRLFHPARRDPAWHRELAGSDPRPIVLHVGRLAHEKNLETLIAAWQRAHARLGDRAAFVVAGEGPLGPRIAAELPFARLLGFLAREQLAALYASAEVCVLPSRTETCGLVALEAMASGLAVVAADAGGLRESIRDGETGLLVAADRPDAFADAIASLIEDPERRRALGAAAQQFALSRDCAYEDAELLALYTTLIEDRAKVTACAA